MISANRVRRCLSEGRPALGPIINFDSPWFVDVAGASGFDFVMLDAEHGPLDAGSIETMVRAAEVAELAAKQDAADEKIMLGIRRGLSFAAASRAAGVR